MRVCIIGCGAIGSLYGAHLARHEGVEVWAYDKNPVHVDAINEHGLQIFGARQFTTEITATVNPQLIPECDMGIIATKTYHTLEAIKETAHLFPNGTLCCLQNGVVNESIVGQYVERVISGTTLVGGHVTAPGKVNFDTNEMTWLGPATQSVSMDEVQSLADILSDEGLSAQCVENISGMKWTKLIFNAAANPLCALTCLPFGEMYSRAPLRELMYGIAREGISVATALGVELHTDPIELLDKASKSATAHVPSMLSDVLEKRPTEIDALNGSIALYGSEKGIDCHLNRYVIALIEGLQGSF